VTPEIARLVGRAQRSSGLTEAELITLFGPDREIFAFIIAAADELRSAVCGATISTWSTAISTTPMSAATPADSVPLPKAPQHERCVAPPTNWILRRLLREHARPLTEGLARCVYKAGSIRALREIPI
jgi:hypothetical protein